MLSPIIDQIAEENHDGLKVCKINVDEENELASAFGVMSIPTIVAFKDGKEVKRNTGFMNEDDLNDFLEKI